MPEQPDNPIFRDYLTKANTAALLGKSEHTLDRWNRQRVGPVRTKIGNTVFYRRQSLEAWIIAQEEETAQRKK